MGRASTQIETRLTGVDATAAAFASVKRRFAAFDRNSVFTRNLNPFAGFGKTNLAKGIGAGFKDIGAGVGLFTSGISAAKGFASGMLGAAGAITAVSAAAAGLAAQKGIETILKMDDFGDAAKKVGMSVNEFKRMNTVFHMLGLGGQELTENVIPKMNKALGEDAGRSALKKLGLSFKEIKMMSPEARFKAVGAAIAGISNELDRVQMETDLFGRSGVELDALFRKGSQAFKDNFDIVGDIGGRFNEAGMDAAGRFADGWDVVKMRMSTAWQNLLGEMLVKIEQRFGPLDQAMLRLWENASAYAQIMWLEIKTNGPIVFDAFSQNVRMAISKIPEFWDAAMDAMWESTARVDNRITNALTHSVGQALFKRIMGNKFDAAKFEQVYDNVTMGPAKKRLNALVSDFKSEWKAPDLVDLRSEKQKIRDAAAAKIASDKVALDAKNAMEQQTSDQMESSLKRGALAIRDAFKDAEAVSSGSYDAFKMAMNNSAVTGLAGSSSGSPYGNSSSAGDADAITGIVKKLDLILSEIKSGNLTRRDILTGITGIGVS